MAVDFKALKVMISITQNKLTELSNLVDEAAEGAYRSDNLGKKNFTNPEKTQLKGRYEALKLELKDLYSRLP